MSVDATRAFLGSYGKIFIANVEQTWVDNVSATVEPTILEMNLAGDTTTRHRVGNMKHSGTMGGFHVTSDMIKHGFKKFDMIVTLEDPEAYGHERVRLKNCLLTTITVAGWTPNEHVKREYPFVFEGYDLLDPVTAT